MFIINWLKRIGKIRLIKEMDVLEPLLAAKIKQAQSGLNNIPPEAFAKTLVDDIQKTLCRKFGVDPKDIDPTF